MANSIVVTDTGLSLTGTLAGDYSLSNPTETTTANITPAALDVTVDSLSKTYGDANPTFAGTLSGVIPGDGITASYGSIATQYSDVGGYTIAATLNDPNGMLGNYTVTNTSGTLTIGKANQTINWSTPAAIAVGTPLSGTQLDAAASGFVAAGAAAGGLTYGTPSGTVPLGRLAPGVDRNGRRNHRLQPGLGHGLYRRF